MNLTTLSDTAGIMSTVTTLFLVFKFSSALLRCTGPRASNLPPVLWRKLLHFALGLFFTIKIGVFF